MNGDHILVDGDQGIGAPAPGGDRRPGLPREGRDAAEAQQAYAALRDKPATTRDGVTLALYMNAGPDGRPAEPAEMRRARGRALPHRAAVPGARHGAEAQRARRALRPHPRFRRREAGDLPHARHRLGQGAALHEAPRRAEPGARLAGDPGRARPPRASCACRCRRCCAAPAAGRCRSCSPSSPRRASSRPRASSSCASSAREQAIGHPVPARAQDRRDARDPEPRLRARTASSSSTDFISIGGNDLKQFFFAADRENELVRRRYDMLSSSFLAFLELIVAPLRRARHAALLLRRGRRPAGGGAGASPPSASAPLDAPRLDRPGQGAPAPGRPRLRPRRHRPRPRPRSPHRPSRAGGTGSAARASRSEIRVESSRSPTDAPAASFRPPRGARNRAATSAIRPGRWRSPGHPARPRQLIRSSWPP